MGQDLFVVILIVLALISYGLNKIPMVVTAMCTMLIVYFTGVLKFSDAFSGFANNTTMMILGVGMLGVGIVQNGLMDIVGRQLNKMFGAGGKYGEKEFLIIGGLMAFFLSAFLNPVLIMALFFEIIDGLSVQEGSRITRRHCYMPMIPMSHAGAMCTILSSTAIIFSSGLAEESGGRAFGFFESALVVGIPYVLSNLIFYSTFGMKLINRVIEFPENPPTSQVRKEEKKEVPKYKFYMTLAIFIATLATVIFGNFSLGAVMVTGGVVMLLTGCVTAKDMFTKLNWQTVVMVASCQGFAKAVDASGAGKLIAETIASWFGDAVSNPMVVCVIALIVGSIVSQFMNNGAAAAIVGPIMVSMAAATGAPVVPVIMAGAVGGACLVSATPVCAPMYTAASVVGYRFKDYFLVGGVMNIMAVIFCGIAIWLGYFGLHFIPI